MKKKKVKKEYDASHGKKQWHRPCDEEKCAKNWEAIDWSKKATEK